MIPGKKYTPDDLIAIVWRRKWLLLIPTVLAAAGAVAYTRTLENIYKSETVVMIQPQRVREDLVKAATTSTATAERIQTITQQIMSRSRLEGIITDLNLYEKERRVGLMEDVVEQMRRDVNVQVIRGDAFRISYISGQPVTAMKVAERLARLFIDENLREREMMAQGTSQFLNSQLDDARRRLVEQEKKLEAYRLAHSGELPSQQQSNLAALSGLQVQVQSLIDAVARDRDKLQLIDRQLAELSTPEAEESAVVDSATGSVKGGSAQQQLDAAKASLAQMELRLKAEHPDIARMRRVIRDLEQRAEAEALAQPLSPEGGRPRSPAEVAKRTRIRQLQQDAEGIRIGIAKKEEEEARLRALASTYRARADAAPTRETELIELNRDYSTLQSLYTNLLEKNEESKLAVNLESRQIGEQFRILDAARVPERPFSPNRTRLNAIGTALGLALGLAVVLLLEWRDTTLKSDDDVRVVTGLPVLAFVPVLVTEADRRRTKRRRYLAGAATAAVVLIGAAGAAYWILRA
jgi:polysaccharide chain length determinant protein (PEP-CTERM system associated)